MKVSVIIPCHNVKDYIENSIRSVFEQSYNKIELIVVDNNSDDGTLEKCLDLRDRLKFELIQEPKQGACFARNTGLLGAAGEWIQFLDADDILKTEKISKQIKLIRDNADVDMIVGNFIYEKQDEEQYIEAYKENWKGLFATRLGITSANLFRRNMLIEVGGWNISQTSSQDYELMFRILKCDGKIIYDDGFNVIKNEREYGQISQTNLENKYINYVELRRNIIFYLMQHNRKYFDERQGWFYQKFLEYLKILYPYNKKKARMYFNDTIPKKFVPKSSESITWIYLFLYRSLGFALTEELRNIKKHINSIANKRGRKK